MSGTSEDWADFCKKAVRPLKPKVILKVEVELDMVPGWGNTGEDFQKHVQNVLNDTIGHYHPVVTIERYNIKELMEELA